MDPNTYILTERKLIFYIVVQTLENKSPSEKKALRELFFWGKLISVEQMKTK